MTSDSGDRRPRRSGGPLLDTVEGLATSVGRVGYGILSLGLDLLPKRSREHMHNAIRELSHAVVTLPGEVIGIAERELDRWASEGPAPTSAPARVQNIAIDNEEEVSTVSTLGAAAAASPALVSIAHIEFDPPGRDIDGEYVLLRNDGTAPADLAGWTLVDGGGKHTFTFPARTLAPGAELKLWTRAGAADGANLFWGNSTAIWNNSGDTATLNDATGAKMASFSYEAKKS